MISIWHQNNDALDEKGFIPKKMRPYLIIRKEILFAFSIVASICGLTMMILDSTELAKYGRFYGKGTYVISILIYSPSLALGCSMLGLVYSLLMQKRHFVILGVCLIVSNLIIWLARSSFEIQNAGFRWNSMCNEKGVCKEDGM